MMYSRILSKPKYLCRKKNLGTNRVILNHLSFFFSFSIVSHFQYIIFFFLNSEKLKFIGVCALTYACEARGRHQVSSSTALQLIFETGTFARNPRDPGRKFLSLRSVWATRRDKTKDK